MSPEEYIKRVRSKLVPALGPSHHKGEAGRIGVIGGCDEYTGAPFFAAMASMRVGADLVHVFCERSAAPVIKGYAPEIIVHPYLVSSHAAQDAAVEVDDIVKRVSSWFGRLHALVIGPGAGRDPMMVDCICKLIAKARSMDLPLVLDADALWMLEQRPELIHGYSRAILTPNAAEFARLCSAMSVEDSPLENKTALEENNHQRLTDAVCSLSSALGNVAVLRKGPVDIMAVGVEGIGFSVHLPAMLLSLTCTHRASLRRAGGQGDVLSGAIATLLCWAAQRGHLRGNGTVIEDSATAGNDESSSITTDMSMIRTATATTTASATPASATTASATTVALTTATPLPIQTNTLLLAAYGGCVVTRECGHRAFEKHGRAMLASDLLTEIGPVFADLLETIHE